MWWYRLVKYQLAILPGLFAYPCQVCSHRFITPCIASMFLLSRSTFRGDLRSAVISRFIARPLRHTGPHHLRRGHPASSFYVGYGTRAWCGRLPKSPGNVARLVTCLSLSSSMLSGTPGVSALRSSFTRSPLGLRPDGKDRHVPKIEGSRGYVSDSGLHPSPRCSRLSSLLLSLSVVTLLSG